MGLARPYYILCFFHFEICTSTYIIVWKIRSPRIKIDRDGMNFWTCSSCLIEVEGTFSLFCTRVGKYPVSLSWSALYLMHYTTQKVAHTFEVSSYKGKLRIINFDKMTVFHLWKKKFVAKQAIIQKKSSSGSAAKLKGTVRCNSARKFLRSAQLGKFQLELITSFWTIAWESG